MRHGLSLAAATDDRPGRELAGSRSPSTPDMVGVECEQPCEPGGEAARIAGIGRLEPAQVWEDHR
jgi:hypothetical protein